ncbi:TetR/AcrR family transcriptional regulator [Methylobacterium sp. NPDC080182]|uniref:TetR/AcrR family transcriptional regulator n=1 Tax=Methylobacterium sp. NPDC080182 TaxID=3390590 RepID=UPI003CFEE340
MSSETGGSDKMPRSPVPRGLRRRAEIAAVAERLFLDHGFSDTTMKMVALEAGASTETLYRHFGTKEDLFIEVVNTRAKDLRGKIDQDLDGIGSLPAVLTAVGTNLYEAMIMPEMFALGSIVVAEVRRNPPLGDAFYAVAPGHTFQKLTAYLTKAGERGEFVGDDTELAANMFIGMIIGKITPVRLFIPHRDTSSQAQKPRHVSEAVRIFLSVYHAKA